MLLIAIYLVGMVERRDRTVWRLGADSLLALLVYFGGLVVLYRLR
jgi:cation:H+ antiporter